ncbi:MAG: hypothetical protein GX298_05635 [Planctomycetes bacterium]|nr:hypothetical protein [Planctomycetota bacterium]
MSVIRREDKEIIHNLSLLGALFGAVVGGFLVLYSHKQANHRIDSKAATAQTQQALVQLTSNLTTEEASVAQAALSQVNPDFQPDIPDVSSEKSFWVDLSPWSLRGLCAGAAMVGSVAGYVSLWGAGWLGAILTYKLIRLIYRVIRAVAPNCAAAQRLATPSGTVCTYQRDQNRLLPTLVKLFMLLTMALSVLAVVIWHLISL